MGWRGQGDDQVTQTGSEKRASCGGIPCGRVAGASIVHFGGRLTMEEGHSAAPVVGGQFTLVHKHWKRVEKCAILCHDSSPISGRRRLMVSLCIPNENKEIGTVLRVSAEWKKLVPQNQRKCATLCHRHCSLDLSTIRAPDFPVFPGVGCQARARLSSAGGIRRDKCLGLIHAAAWKGKVTHARRAFAKSRRIVSR